MSPPDTSSHASSADAATSPAARRELRGEAEQPAVQAPQSLRALVRGDEIWLTIVAAALGVVAGLLVVGMNQVSQLAHQWLYNLPTDARLSGQTQLDRWRALCVPVVGGVLVGLLALALARWRPARTVDPIEANALYGGRMSLGDSLVTVVQTLLSNGVGASVGLEAGYTQIGAAVGSKLGRLLRVRRADLRLLVGCGAAGAIASAFNAPLAGAFYAFELVIGTYSLGALGPVVAAAISAVSVLRVFLGDEPGYGVALPGDIGTVEFVPVLLLGALCALVGVAIMYGVTLTERAFAHSHVPVWLRPAMGGVVLANLALLTPAVLSAGHGALREDLTGTLPWRTVLILLVLKATASAVSLGSGFRGGLFFASLFLGALLGKLFAALMLAVWPVPVFPDAVYGLIGMSGMATAIVGGPLTMTFLALETTGSLPLTVAVLAACVLSSLTVRRTFGYSFATWRFHLRGESIRSAVDVGWVRNLTVGRMMRRDIHPIRTDTSLASFRRDYPLGSAKGIVAVDDAGRYAGIVWVADAHAAGVDVARVAELVQHPGAMLTPEMTVREAARLFETAEADALAVVDTVETRRVLGLLTEKYALRRYSEELERRRRDLSGE